MDCCYVVLQSCLVVCVCVCESVKAGGFDDAANPTEKVGNIYYLHTYRFCFVFVCVCVCRVGGMEL